MLKVYGNYFAVFMYSVYTLFMNDRVRVLAGAGEPD